MTRKDYQAIASAISSVATWANTYYTVDTCRHIAPQVLLTLVEQLSDYLEDDNPRFNAEKFSKACGF